METFKKEAHKFSLLNDGTLDKPVCGRLLLVNVRRNLPTSSRELPLMHRLQGTEDEIFPIDDYYLTLQHGPPKEARCVS